MQNERQNNPFVDPIIVQDTRILRPWEYKQLKKGIPKNEYRTVFDALLCSGMRYTEFYLFQDNPNWFSEKEKKIYLPKIAIKKKKIKRKQRWIRLSDYGTQAVSSFLNSGTNAPERKSWYDDLKRWTENSGIELEGINVKITRKTYESWLLEYFGRRKGEDNITLILLSQGHTKETAINHYLSLAFSEKDHQDMTYLMEGWL
jgi:hypothetical protein